jgi:uncharacterized protein YgbK (DUF1537 family)
LVSSRVTRRRLGASLAQRVDEALESASSIKIRSRRSPRFMMYASKLDSQFAGNIGGVALADTVINIKNRPFYA